MKYLLFNILAILLMVGCKNEVWIVDNTCEYMCTPLAVDAKRPKLGWKILSKEYVNQISYQILVSDNKSDIEQNRGNYWDSGEVNSDCSCNIPYDGKDLISGKIYYWKVRIKDDKGHLSDWSKIASWRQADLGYDRVWIAYKSDKQKSSYFPSFWYRYTFKLEDKVKTNVFAEISTTGYYELYINGKKVGNDMLSPAVTGKDKRTFYVTYQVNEYLKTGNNVIGIWTGRGWGGEGDIPLHFRMEIPQKEERVIKVETSKDWRVYESNYATIGKWKWGNFGGEILDARISSDEWNKPYFDDSSWHSPVIVETPSPEIEAQSCELNRYTVYNKAPIIRRISDNYIELDFGTNITGFVSLNIKNVDKSDSVKIYYADKKMEFH